MPGAATECNLAMSTATLPRQQRCCCRDLCSATAGTMNRDGLDGRLLLWALCRLRVPLLGRELELVCVMCFCAFLCLTLHLSACVLGSALLVGLLCVCVCFPLCPTARCSRGGVLADKMLSASDAPAPCQCGWLCDATFKWIKARGSASRSRCYPTGNCCPFHWGENFGVHSFPSPLLEAVLNISICTPVSAASRLTISQQVMGPRAPGADWSVNKQQKRGREGPPLQRL